MNLKLIDRLFRLGLSLTVAVTTSSSITYGAELKGGGGKQPPPNLPPTTYDNGGGSSNSQNPNKPQAPKQNDPGKFGDLWAVDSTGVRILRAGYLDAQGNVVVFRRPSPSSPYVRRGAVVKDIAHPDGVSIAWSGKQEMFSDFNKEMLARNVAPKAKPSWAYPPVAAEGHGLLEWAGEVSNRVFRFQGRRDQFGRELVFRPAFSESTGFDLNTYETGIWSAGGRIQIDKGYTTYNDLIKVLSAENLQNRKDLTRDQKADFAKNQRLLTSRAYKYWGTNFSDEVEVKSGNAPGETRVTKFQGRADSQGNELVFRATRGANGDNLTSFETGTYEAATGRVLWNGGVYTSEDFLRTLKQQVIAKKGRSPELQKRVSSRFDDLQKSVTDYWTKIQMQASAPATTVQKAPAKMSAAANQKVPQNYPEVALDKTPIPSSRALTVPYDSHVTSEPVVGGHSGMNSPSRTYIPEFDPENKPSNLRKALDWTVQSRDDFKESVRKIFKGDEDLVTLKNDPTISAALKKPKALTNDEAVERLRGSTAVKNFPMYAASFYIALGLAAGYNLMTNYPNNPVAWDDYIASLKDPVQYMALAGFMLGASPFYKLMGGPGYKGTVLRRVPLFAAALLSGQFIGTIVGDMGHDPDVQSCLGFTSYSKTGHFQPSLSHCDFAYQKFTSSEQQRNYLVNFTNTFVPVAARMVVAGAIFYPTYSALSWGLTRIGMVRAMQSVPISKSPKGGWVTLAVGVGQMALFLGAYEIADQVFNVEKSVKEYLVASHGIFSDPNGTTLSDAESNILNEWVQVRKAGWKEQHVCYDPIGELKPVSEDAVRFGAHSNSALPPEHLFRNCEGPGKHDFLDSLERYAKLQRDWRVLQMSDTMDSYNHWIKNVDQYQSTLDASYRFYKANVDSMVDFNLHGPSIGPISENPKPYVSDQNFDGPWKFVETPKLTDFLLTSMACGPEAEGFGGSQSGMLSTISNFYNNHINPSPNSNPQNVIDDVKGFSIKFYPPRVVTPSGGSNDSICQNPAYGNSMLPDPVGWLSNSHIRFTPENFPYEDSTGNKYRGLRAYIGKNLRTSMLNENVGSRFDIWWSDNLMSQAVKVDGILRSDFKRLLDTTYKSALTNQDVYYCEPGIQGTGLEKYLLRFESGHESCSPVALHRLSVGVFNNLHEQLRFDFAMLTELFLENVGPGGPLPGSTDENPILAKTVQDYENTIVPAVKDALNLNDVYLQNLAITDPKQRGDVKQMQADVNAKITAIATMIINSNIGTAPGKEYQQLWTTALLANIGSLLNESEDYYKILTTFEK